jgi:hypothetical protein
MNGGKVKLWIEEQVEQDSLNFRDTIKKFAQEFEPARSRYQTSNTRLRENKRDTNDFFTQFFNTITENELEVYNMITLTKWNTNYHNKRVDTVVGNSGGGGGGGGSGGWDENYIENIQFKIQKVLSPANLPRPSMLESLRHKYDNGHVNKSTNDTSGDFKFIPKPIYNYIRDNSEWWIQFKYRINGRDITLHFITYPESKISICDKSVAPPASSSSHKSSNQTGLMCAKEIAIYQTYAYKAFLWLTIVSKMSDNNCSGESLNVYIYMTPFKKNIPSMTPTTRQGDTLSAIHVNTGVTQNCQKNGEIIIYRYEEWFKVLIHETMHNFNMDFIDTELSKMNTLLRESFIIPHNDILIFETYTEGWARIIYTMFEAYFDPSVRNQSGFIHIVREKLHYNAIFAALQLTKVLDVMDLEYSHITIQSKENLLRCEKNYKEESNIYAYYILGGVLSVFSLPFISWCMANNKHSSRTIKNQYRRNHVTDSIRFLNNNNNNLSAFFSNNDNSSSLMKLATFINECSRDSQMLSIVAFCEKKLDNIHKQVSNGYNYRLAATLRMTI